MEQASPGGRERMFQAVGTAEGKNWKKRLGSQWWGYRYESRPLTDAGRSTPVAESLHLQVVLKVPECHLLVICPPQSDFTSLSLILHICKMRIKSVFGLRMRGKHGDYSMYHSAF